MKKYIVVLLLIFVSSSYVIAEKINREMVIKETLCNNSAIAVARLALNNAEEEYRYSLNLFFPKVNFLAEVLHSNNEERCLEKYSYGVNGYLPLFSGFKEYNDVKSKAARVKLMKASYERVVSDAVYDADVQYINLMWAYETVELLKKIKMRIKEDKDLIELKYNSGDVSVDLLKMAEADITLAEYNLKSAQRYIETASVALLRATGRNENISILETDERILISDIGVVLQRQDSNKIIMTIPEFLIAKYKVEGCKAQNLKAKGQWLPSVGLLGKVLWVDNKWVPENKVWEAGLSFSYPIFTRGKRWGDIKVTSNQLKIASEKLRGTICDLKAKAVEYYNNLIDAQDIIKAKASRLSALKMRAEISSKKYVNGLSSYCDWYTIENEYINSQRELLNFKKEAVLAKAKWDNFIGSVITENEKGNE